MSGVIHIYIFKTTMLKFTSKDCYERHDLCLLFIIWSSENAVLQRYVNAKGINISKVAFEINEYFCYHLNQSSVRSGSFNLVLRARPSLILINCSFAAHWIWNRKLYFKFRKYLDENCIIETYDQLWHLELKLLLKVH